MYRVQLIHWKDEEAEERLEKLRSAGFHAMYDPLTPDTLKDIRNDPPDAVVIDLGRLPSHGREVAVALRDAKKTRHIPIVFVDGMPEKVAKTKEQLPDATYCSWPRIRPAVESAISSPPTSPVVPPNQMSRGAKAPLLKKLDIKPSTVVVIMNGPDDFRESLGEIPADVILRTSNRGKRDLTIWFVDQVAEFHHRLDALTSKMEDGSLWIAYPKQASGRKTDITQKMIRETCLEVGLVDYKIASIDTTWTGIKFTWRKKS